MVSVVCMDKRFVNGTNASNKVVNQLQMMLELTSTTDEIVKNVLGKLTANRRITIRVVAEEAGILYGSFEAIFTDVLGMRQVAAKFVLKLLNFQQKLHHKEISEQMINEVSSDLTPVSYTHLDVYKRQSP